MTDDLLARLRRVEGTGTTQHYRNPEGPEAAAEIEGLQELRRAAETYLAGWYQDRHRAKAAEAKCERLREALKPFADAADGPGDETDDMDEKVWEPPLARAVKISDFRRARTALAADPPQQVKRPVVVQRIPDEET